MGKFGAVVDHIDALTPAEFDQSLLAAGIVGKDGKLAKKYQAKKD